MEQFPDEMVLMLMRYMDVPDVLACRVACKRLADLALHPLVWRHRAVDSRDAWMRPVLRLAPCLREARISTPASTASHQLFTSTRCSVSMLNVFAAKNDGVAQAAQVIRHQEALGRLKHIDLMLFLNSQEQHDGTASSELLWAVASMPGLETLDVGMHTGNFYYPFLTTAAAASFPLPRSPPRPSLKSFRCTPSAMMGPFCNAVLAEHAATLEKVDLAGDSNYRGAAARLASMPNLHVLSCPLIPGLEAVATCGSLRKVTLYVNPDSQTVVPDAAKFLRDATQLREVTLKYSNLEFHSHNQLGSDLVKALVSSGPSLVESLTIDLETRDEEGEAMNAEPHNLPQLDPLVEALPLMTALQSLQVDALPNKLLQAITPAAAPALRVLRVQPRGVDGSGCAHHYLHLRALKNTLSANPSLELLVSAYRYYCLEENECAACVLDCHRGVWVTGNDGESKTVDWIKIPRLGPVLIE